MPFFKLLAGLHEQADPEWERPEDADPATRAPSRTYRVGEIVESDADLVDKFGPQKFLYVGESPPRRRGMKALKKPAFGEVEEGDFLPGDPTPELRRKNPSFAPGGQVTTGHQQTTGAPDGRSVSGPALREDETAEDRAPGDHTIEQRTTAARQPGTTPTPAELVASRAKGKEKEREPEDVDHLDDSPDRPSGPGATPLPKSGTGETGSTGGASTTPSPSTPPGPSPRATQPAGTPPQSDREYHAMLDKMSLPDLKKHAEEEEVDLGGATTKPDILKKLKAKK